jgi:non-heme chloroperoxidase
MKRRRAPGLRADRVRRLAAAAQGPGDTGAGPPGTASLPTVVAALAGNVLVAVTKFVAAALSGSASMLSEAVHSLVDTLNELLLLYGLRRAAQPPDRAHPFGHGREIYFWSFVVAVLLFVLGACVSVYQGIARIRQPEPIENAIVNYVVLALSALFEGASWLVSLRAFREAKGDLGYWEGFRVSDGLPCRVRRARPRGRVKVAISFRGPFDVSRRSPFPPRAAWRPSHSNPPPGAFPVSTITTRDGTTIFYKDWGAGQPIVFHHGWPLSGDDWDAQMMFFLAHGYRVIAHDRRGHGRSSQTDAGNEMDTYAADVAALAAHLDLRDTVHIGHSTGGGEVTRYVARHGKGRVAKAVLIGAVPPVMVKSAKNPGGLPIEVFDGFRSALVANRAQFYRDVPGGPFYGYNRPGAKVQPGVVDNWWRQGMAGGIKAHYDCIKAFSETDFTEDLQAIDVPVLVLHGDDDQIVPIADSARLSAPLLKKGTLKVYPSLPHGMCTTHPEVINPDLLAFVRGEALSA